jgi:hypothetical protein
MLRVDHYKTIVNNLPMQITDFDLRTSDGSKSFQISSQLGYQDLLMWQSTLNIYEPSTNNPFSSSITSQARGIIYLPYNHNQEAINKDKSQTM